LYSAIRNGRDCSVTLSAAKGLFLATRDKGE